MCIYTLSNCKVRLIFEQTVVICHIFSIFACIMRRLCIKIKVLCLFTVILWAFGDKISASTVRFSQSDTVVTALSEDEINEALMIAIDSVVEVPLEWPQSMTVGIAKLLENPMFNRTQVAILVYDLDGDSVLYDHGSYQLMRPASVMKLLTSTTALNSLGGDHLFKTQLYYTGEVCDSTLHGDIYIKGGFDPLFGSDDMYAFIQSLKQKEIFNIDGNIYADVSFKDTLKWGEGWCWDDKEATLTPLLYDGKNVFMEKFMQRLTAEGIKHPLTYIQRRAEGEDLVCIEQRTHSVDQMLTHMMKASDNLYAESLFYQLGASNDKPYASARNSADKVYALIRELGLSPDDYTIADGSGLSLYNYITPQLVVRLLRYVWQRNNIYNHLYPTLPISGVDGTLRNRMKGTPAYGKIHAKTGTLRKVSTLAGYTRAANGTNLAFCIFNQGLLNSAEGRSFQDDVCNQLVK